MAEVLEFRTPPRFVADERLGRLVRYLRMVGFDALSIADDQRLVEIAREEKRRLLTVDRARAESAPEISCWVEASDPREQMPEVVAKLGLGAWLNEGRGFLTRCLECNTLLLPAKPHQVTERVPGHLLTEHEEFFLCTHCERVFWEGAHVDQMREWVRSWLP